MRISVRLSARSGSTPAPSTSTAILSLATRRNTPGITLTSALAAVGGGASGARADANPALALDGVDAIPVCVVLGFAHVVATGFDEVEAVRIWPHRRVGRAVGVGVAVGRALLEGRCDR